MKGGTTIAQPGAAASLYPALLGYATILCRKFGQPEDRKEDFVQEAYSRAAVFPEDREECYHYLRQALLRVFLNAERRRPYLRHLWPPAEESLDDLTERGLL